MLVCGVRNDADRSALARGADRFAQEWANANGVAWIVYDANWTKHGRAAGPIRNQQMLDEGRPTLVVAFPGGRGTADMVRRARECCGDRGGGGRQGLIDRPCLSAGSRSGSIGFLRGTTS